MEKKRSPVKQKAKSKTVLQTEKKSKTPAVNPEKERETPVILPEKKSKARIVNPEQELKTPAVNPETEPETSIVSPEKEPKAPRGVELLGFAYKGSEIEEPIVVHIVKRIKAIDKRFLFYSDIRGAVHSWISGTAIDYVIALLGNHGILRKTEFKGRPVFSLKK